MSERTKLLKKAVLTGVGASSNGDRIKKAISEAMEDLVQVGQDLLVDLESKGKDRTESLQQYLKNLQEEATRRTGDMQGQMSTKMQSSIKKAAKDLGLITREEYDELLERVSNIEDTLAPGDEEQKKSRSKSKKSASSD